MKQIAILTITALVSPIAFAQAAGMSESECEVWERERSFAQTVVDHDADAFASHLHPDAVFFSGSGPLRGRAAATADWLPIIAGEGMTLRWHPDTVTVAEGTGVAISRGPYWVESTDADGEPRHGIGRFMSVWQRNAGGVWQVIFDGAGATAAQPATAEEIERLLASLPKSCPEA